MDINNHYIQAQSIGEAWVSALRLVILNGKVIPDDKGNIIEVLPLIIEMANPTLHDPIITKYGDQQQLQFLAKNYEHLTDIESWQYSYGQRLYAYNGIDQIQRMVNLLKQNPYSKSATISLLDTAHDTLHTPCLTTLDFKIRDKTLIVTATFRSQDIGKKMYGDAFELLKLGTKIISTFPVDNVIIIHTIASAHIYHSDLPMINHIVSSLSLE